VYLCLRQAASQETTTDTSQVVALEYHARSLENNIKAFHRHESQRVAHPSALATRESIDY